jgi:hypothetical protein
MATNSRTTSRKPAAKKPAKNQKQTAARTAKTPVKSKNVTKKQPETVKKTQKSSASVGRRGFSWRPNGAKKEPNPVTKAALNTWHKWLALLHFVQGLAIILLAQDSDNRLFPVTNGYVVQDPLASADGNEVFVSAAKHAFDVNLPYLLAAIFILTALAHFLAATYLRNRYENELEARASKTRWITFSVTFGLIVAAIALLVGVSDLGALISLFALTAVASLVALAIELNNQGRPKVRRLSFLISSFAGIVPWVVLGLYIINGAIYGELAAWYVYAVFAALFLLFAAKAVVTYLQLRGNGRWSNYLYSERTYWVIALLANSALAWILYAGLLQP